MCNTNKILWIHPRLRDYRKPLFDLMNQKYDIRFIFGIKNPEIEDNYNSIYLNTIRTSFRQKTRIKELEILRKEIKTASIIITSFLSNKSTFFVWGFSKIYKKKIIVWEEHHYFHNSLRKRLIYFYTKMLAKNIHAFYVMGEPQRVALEKIGVSSSKIFMANECSGVNYDNIYQKEISLGFDLRNNKYILYLGRLIAIKGSDLLINAFRRIEDSNLYLVIAGEGEEILNLRNLAKGDNRIKFIGPINDLNEKSYILKNAEVLVLPSKIISGKVVEAGGIVLLEALSSGTPIIAAIGSTTKFIKNGITGYKFQENSVDDLKEKLEYILINKKLGKLSRENILNEYKKIPGYDHQFNILAKAIQHVLE